MKEKLLRTKKELEKEYKNNSKEIRNLEEKIKILELNTIDGKFYVFAKSFAISFPILMILSIIIAFISPNFVGNIIGMNPVYMMRNLAIGSLVSGIVLESTLSKVNHKKLNRFSSAKTDEQKREEILEYELEKQKLNDKNNAIEKAYDFTSDLETKVDVCNLDFGNSNMSKDEQEKNNKKLRENISIKERELEISSTQLFLNENFARLRSKLGKLETVGTPFVIGLMTGVFASFGAFVFEPTLLPSTSTLAGSVLSKIGLIGGTIGTITSSATTYLRNRQNRRIFNKFNNRLCEDKLPENIDNDIVERRKIVTKGNKSIEELATAHLAYQDSTRELERLIASELVEEENQQKKIKTWDDLLYTEEEIHQYMQMPDTSTPFNSETIFGPEKHTDEEYEIEGPTLVKRK